MDYFLSIKLDSMVSTMGELIILLPTRNEEEGLGEVIERIPEVEIEKRGFSHRVIVVDGYSTDLTCEIANERGVELIHQSGGIGKGNGVRQAIDSILSRGVGEGDCLIMLDADATYFPEEIPKFLDQLKEVEVVWGSRLRGKMEPGAMSKTNKFGNRILSLAASMVFLHRTTDLCTGFWGFRADSLNRLSLTAEGFTLEADLFGSVIGSKMSTKEIPVDYANRQGSSTLKWYKDGPRILMMTIRKRFSR